MKQCTPSMMEGYFEQYGWTFKSYQTSTWKTGFGDEDSEYNILVHMSDHNIRFEISPFNDSPMEWDLWPEVLMQFMELKEEIPVLKLNISAAGDLTLSTEVLTGGFSFENFCNIVGILELHSHNIRERAFHTMRNNGLHYFEEPVYLS